MRNGRRWNGRR